VFDGNQGKRKKIIAKTGWSQWKSGIGIGARRKSQGEEGRRNKLFLPLFETIEPVNLAEGD
jgi:hypothetical protein